MSILFSTYLEKNVQERPSYQEYFMMIAFVVSLRSDDLFIKHGAVIVDNLTNHIIGTGYNGTFKGCDTSKINIQNRDERRPWMIHSEENAMFNCTKNPLELPNGASIYVTGLPCVNCLQRIVNFGIKTIYMAQRDGSITENNNTQKMREQIIEMSKIKICEIAIDNKWIKGLLNAKFE